MDSDAERWKMERNLKVLKRFDPLVKEILGSASHVALYEFDLAGNKWERRNVEGSLFVLRRSAEPEHQLFIMNKKSTDNFTEELSAGFTFEVQLPYLIYRSSSDAVVGMWFLHETECIETEQLLRQIMQSKRHPVPHTPAAGAAAGGGQQTHHGGSVAATEVAPPATGNICAQETHDLMTMLNINGQKEGGAAANPPAQESGDRLPELFTPNIFRPKNPGRTPPASSSQSHAPSSDMLGTHPLPEVLQRMKDIAQQEKRRPAPAAAPEDQDKRQRVREAMERLLDNDQFLDLVARELEGVGLL